MTAFSETQSSAQTEDLSLWLITVTLAVALAIVIMYLTHTLHPPGVATAPIAVHDKADWLFALTPVTAGAIILIIVAVIANNMVNHRRYPLHWW